MSQTGQPIGCAADALEGIPGADHAGIFLEASYIQRTRDYRFGQALELAAGIYRAKKQDELRRAAHKVEGFEILANGDVILATPAGTVLVTSADVHGIAEAARSKNGA